MATLRLCSLLLAALAVICSGQGPGDVARTEADILVRRFEYKYSFKPPYLAQKDGSVPFFEYAGNTIASEESVRITPSLKSQKGSIWSKLASTFDAWEVELQFRVTGRGRVGADGLAFWFSSTKGFGGPVFGSADKWNGLGLFFDSYDNDNKHNNPYIMGMVNDGTKAYDHQNDGTTQQLAGCLRDFRNKPFPVRAKIEYYRNILTVYFHNGMSNNEKDFELCFRSENVVLPKAGYFGISAATGGLADDHDVVRFTVNSLRSPEMALASDSVQDAESKKFEDEFVEYQKKLDQQKDEWAQQNPDKVKPKPGDDDWDNWFTDQDKELQQIFQGQSLIKEIVSLLHKKMDEIVVKQDSSLGILGSLQGGPLPQVGVSGGQAVPFDTIRRDEVNAVLSNQRDVVNAVRDIKNIVSDIHTKTTQIIARGSGSVQQVGGGYDVEGSVKDVKDSLNLVKRDVGVAMQKLSSQAVTSCPNVEVSCVSTSFVMILLFSQMAVLLAFFIFREKKKDQSKKYF